MSPIQQVAFIGLTSRCIVLPLNISCEVFTHEGKFSIILKLLSSQGKLRGSCIKSCDQFTQPPPTWDLDVQQICFSWTCTKTVFCFSQLGHCFVYDWIADCMILIKYWKIIGLVASSHHHLWTNPPLKVDLEVLLEQQLHDEFFTNDQYI